VDVNFGRTALERNFDDDIRKNAGEVFSAAVFPACSAAVFPVCSEAVLLVCCANVFHECSAAVFPV